MYTVIEGQSLADVANLVYGSVDGVFWLLEDNPTLKGLAVRLRGGQKLVIRTDQINPQVVAYLADYAPIASLEYDDQARGIGFEKVGELRVKSGLPGAFNIAPMCTVSFSSVHPDGFLNAKDIVNAELPNPFFWVLHGWNDGTDLVFPDWVEFVWPSSMLMYAVTIRSLNAAIQPATDETLDTPYSLIDYQLQAFIGSEYQTIVTVSGNLKGVRYHAFSSTVITNKLKLIINNGGDRWSRLTQFQVWGR